MLILEGRFQKLIEATEWATENLKPGTWSCPLITDHALMELRRVIETNDVSHPIYPTPLPGGWDRIYTLTFFFKDDISHVHFKLRWK